MSGRRSFAILDTGRRSAGHVQAQLSPTRDAQDAQDALGRAYGKNDRSDQSRQWLTTICTDWRTVARP